MSSLSVHTRSQSPHGPFQSAQRPQDQISIEDEELDSASEKLFDAPSLHDTPTREQNLQDNGILFRGEDNEDEEGQKALDVSPNEDSSTSSPIPLRPNKYRGPASTWRNWTAPERELAASLDQLTAKDLSVHLYNAFKLKQRKGDQDEHPGAQMSEEGDEAGDMNGWRPPKVWTAWPLPPETVPREEEKHWEEKVVLPHPYIVKPKMPGDILREILVAEVLRKARSRFTQREWGDMDEDEQRPTSLKPVVMADDERASEILRPTVQHGLTKLDGLLMGLHYARSAYLAMDKSASESRSRTRGRPASRGSARKRKRGVSSNDTSAGLTSGISPAFESECTMVSKSKSRSKSTTKHGRSSSHNSTAHKFHQRKSRLGLRDWGDVLGVASMTSWESAVVEKAATRCASLFRHGITFRTLEEGGEGGEGYAERRHLNGAIAPTVTTKAKEAMAREGAASSRKNEKDMVGGVHVDGYLEPIEGKKAWKYQNKASNRGRGRPRSKH